MGRYGKWVAIVGCALAAITSALSAEGVYAVPTDLSGSCNAGIYTGIYISISTGTAFNCPLGTWAEFPLGTGSSNGDWVMKGLDPDADGVLPIVYYPTPSLNTWRLQYDLDADGSIDMEMMVPNGTSSNPLFYIGEDAGSGRSYWSVTGFSSRSSLAISANNVIQAIPDYDNGGGDNSLELKTKWSGGNPYTTFRFQNETLTFEGAADDGNEIIMAPAGTLTGSTTLTLPSKTGGVVVLNGTTYPTGPLCAEWQSDGRLGIASTNAACGSSGSGDNIRVETSAGPTFTAASDADLTDSTFIDFTLNATPTPDQISATIKSNSITGAEIATGAVYSDEINNNTIVALDLSPTLTFDNNDMVNLGAIDMSNGSGVASNTEGFVLPRGNLCATSTTSANQAQMCYKSDESAVYVYSGTAWMPLNGDVTSVWGCTGSACTAINATASTHTLRPTTTGIVGLRYTPITDANNNDSCSTFGLSTGGDMLVDLTDNEIFTCGVESPTPLLHLLGGSSTPVSGITVEESNGASVGGQTTLDFGSGFDKTADGTAETDISLDVEETSLNKDHMWVGGAITSNTLDKATQIPLENCVGSDKTLNYKAGNTGAGEDPVWSCVTLSASSIAQMVDYDLDGVNPEISIGDGSNYIRLDPNDDGSYDWEFKTATLLPRLASANEIGSPTLPLAAVYANNLQSEPKTSLTSDPDTDGTPDTKLEVDASGLKLYLGEGTTTPSIALVTGGIDADNDGIADNLTQVGLNKSMPNYNKTFTNETTVVMDDHYLGTDNLVTVCYDGSNNQITPTSVSIGASPVYAVTATFSTGTTGRCVVNGGANSRYVTTFSNQITVTIPQADIGIDPYAARVSCYDDASPRNRVEPDSVTVDDATLDLTINFAVGQSGRCTVS